MSKALRDGKKPLYEHPWVGEVEDANEMEKEYDVWDEELGPLIGEEHIEDDPNG